MEALDSLRAAAELVAEIEPEQAVAILLDAGEAAVYGADREAALDAASRARELAPEDGGAEDIHAELVLGEALLYVDMVREGNARITRAASLLEQHDPSVTIRAWSPASPSI